MSECVSRYMLARLQSGDLPDDEAKRIRAHVETCDACGRAMGELASNVADFDARQADQLDRLMARIDADGEIVPMHRERPGSKRQWLAVGALAAAAMLALGLMVVLNRGASAPAPDEVGFKGTMSVEVVAKRGDQQFKVAPKSALTENDALRFIVTTATPGYLDLFSVDAAGQVYPYYPESDPLTAPAPMEIPRPGKQVLPGSVILDDSRGTEHIIVVFSKKPFRRDEIQDEIRLKVASDPDARLLPKTSRDDVVIEHVPIRKE